MTYPKRPWKKSFRKIPQDIVAKLEEYGDQPLKVSSARVVSKEHIINGHLESLGIFYNGEGDLCVPSEPVLPSPDNGTWAKRNIDGWVITRKDLPRISKTFSVEVPNFGDYSRGVHDMTWTRKCYQREVVSPLDACIAVTHKESTPNQDGEVFGFELQYTLEQNETDFQNQLLMCINILQESTGCSDVFLANATHEEVFEQRFVDWEIFPPGIADSEFKKRIGGSRISEGAMKTALERKVLLESLEPQSIIRGRNLGSSVYFGAKFSDELVVFENIRTGNAIYVMFGNWEELSKLSRSELLRNYDGYIRIRHAGNWEKQLRWTVARYRNNSNSK